MTGLVLEGGAFRGLYTDGVLDALLEKELLFDYIIGVSAGISNAYSYASGQKGRNWEIIHRFVQDKRYFGLSNMVKCHSIFGLDFVFGEVPKVHIPFDHEAFVRYQGCVKAGVTDALSGKCIYFDADREDKDFTLLRASCAIPLFFPVISYKGGKYFDGGLADPIPIKKAIEDGCKKSLVVLTQPLGYEKKPTKGAGLAGLKYKNLVPVIKERHIKYNQSVAYCEELEQKGEIVLLRPKGDVVVDRFERDLDKLYNLYKAGYEDTIEKIEDIKKLFIQ